ncbi:ABC transporter ATP-binding protein [Cytobacillus oceanisediminis]|uniref:ABC transporter ATP-binding protein n=1 Tax=Cytobacillus oceanisediminis TaxID=665099 RepID=UPI00203C2181|nr:ABC transporter ATP-binding protein [Cytobacillus oceanisediminis]MCM3393133.1 ABC transporter ATP-binding protein/permease [Cytobacillus oceanisediminis]
MNNETGIRFYHYRNFLKKYYFVQLKSVSLLFFLVAILLILQLWTPQLLKDFIDSIKAMDDKSPLIKIGMIYVGASIGIQLISIGSTFLGEKIGWSATNNLRRDLIKHCISLDIEFHKQIKPGELVERIDGDTNQLANFFSQFIVSTVNNILLIIGILIMLFIEGWLIGSCLTIFVIISFFIISKIRNFAVPFWVKVREIRTEYFGKVTEFLEGIEALKANRVTQYAIDKTNNVIKKWLPIRLKAQLASITLWMSIVFIFALGNAIALLVSTYLWSLDQITIGTIYMIFFYTELLRQPIEQIRLQIDNLQSADASIKRINELLNYSSSIKKEKGDISLNSPNKGIKFDGVYFKYNSKIKANVLHDINFEVNTGETLAIIGDSGSGKTTITKLLFRFYDPLKGNIYLDGQNIRSLALSDLRKRIAWVSQDIELLNTTVRNNITLFNKGINDEEIIEIIKDLGMHSYLEALPNGLDTVVQENGKNLSVGETQFLTWCRAILKKADIIILDEASSKMDLITESVLMERLKKYLQTKTVIIIAHRLQNIVNADHIILLNRGKIEQHLDKEIFIKNSEQNSLL